MVVYQDPACRAGGVPDLSLQRASFRKPTESRLSQGLRAAVGRSRFNDFRVSQLAGFNVLQASKLDLWLPLQNLQVVLQVRWA